VPRITPRKALDGRTFGYTSDVLNDELQDVWLYAPYGITDVGYQEVISPSKDSEFLFLRNGVLDDVTTHPCILPEVE
jgi:hypothetical protein